MLIGNFLCVLLKYAILINKFIRFIDLELYSVQTQIIPFVFYISSFVTHTTSMSPINVIQYFRIIVRRHDMCMSYSDQLFNLWFIVFEMEEIRDCRYCWDWNGINEWATPIGVRYDYEASHFQTTNIRQAIN